MKILVLTPIYPSPSSPEGATPVVHYFAKEWVRQGHDVHVIRLAAKYPRLYYWFGRRFHKSLSSKTGMIVPIHVPFVGEGKLDRVVVSHRSYRKIKPHGLYSKKTIRLIVEDVLLEVEKRGKPDVIIGHWDNPQLEVLSALHERLCVPTVLVLHGSGTNLPAKYGNERFRQLMKGITILGFRNNTAQRLFLNSKLYDIKTFVAYSGVSEDFIKATPPLRGFEKVDSYIYVGNMISRKYPLTIVEALNDVYGNELFNITYVGDGEERGAIEHFRDGNSLDNKIHLVGRKTRSEVMDYLKAADVFVMISRGEAFGLVYLEAMAMGCIVIASRGEGIDGIVIDGQNGFLCEAGNKEELSNIINRIRCMNSEELNRISANAIDTARKFSDSNVAKRYLDDVGTLISSSNEKINSLDNNGLGGVILCRVKSLGLNSVHDFGVLVLGCHLTERRVAA